MCALELALMVQELQILADGYQGGTKAPREVADENSAFRLKQFEDFAPALFAQHRDRDQELMFRFISNTLLLLRFQPL